MKAWLLWFGRVLSGLWEDAVDALWAARGCWEEARGYRGYVKERDAQKAACRAQGGHFWRFEEAAGQGKHWLHRCTACRGFEWFADDELPREWWCGPCAGFTSSKHNGFAGDPKCEACGSADGEFKRAEPANGALPRRVEEGGRSAC